LLDPFCEVDPDYNFREHFAAALERRNMALSSLDGDYDDGSADSFGESMESAEEEEFEGFIDEDPGIRDEDRKENESASPTTSEESITGLPLREDMEDIGP